MNNKPMISWAAPNVIENDLEPFNTRVRLTGSGQRYAFLWISGWGGVTWLTLFSLSTQVSALHWSEKAVDIDSVRV